MNSLLLQELRKTLQPSIDSTIEKMEMNEFKKTGKMFSDHVKTLIELELIYDMSRSVEKYTSDGDKLVEVSSSISKKGNIEISMVVERDSKQYGFYTEVIYAGGWNIQRLHYRYLTKTDLPLTNKSTVTDGIKKEIKKLTRIEKLILENQGYKNRMDNALNDLKYSQSLSDDQILKIVKSENPDLDVTWETIVKRGAHINYQNSREVFETSKQNFWNEKVEFWKVRNIKWKLDTVKTSELNINKNMKIISDLS
jgi:hypothetical protein